MNIDVRNPLRIYLIWDDNFNDGEEYAKIVYDLVCRPIKSPTERGIGVPIEFINKISSDIKPLAFSENMYNLIFIFIDDYFISKKFYWNEYLKKIEKELNNGIMIPIAFDCSPYTDFSLFRDKNYVVVPPTNKNEYFQFTVSYEVSRALNQLLGKKGDIKLFLSHNKSTGDKIVKKVRREIHDSSKLNTFYDEHDIPHGDRFDLKIYENIKDSIVIVFLTDGFSSRDWCKKEVIAAKEYGQPTILLDFYEEGELRLFPYLGNVRVISLDHDRIRYYKLLTAIMIEHIKMSFYRLHSEYLIKLLNINVDNYEIMTLPPELLTVINHQDSEKLYIYPEPPISNDELDIIEKVVDSNNYSTPIMFSMSFNYSKSKLSDISVGISVSYDNNSSLIERLKLEDIITNITKYLLASNAKIYYAGDPNYKENKSFSLLMLNIEDKYQMNNTDAQNNLYLVLSKFSKTNLSIKTLNKINRYANVIYHDELDKEITMEKDLTLTRKKLINNINAHILLGGKVENYMGELPGILQEFIFSVKHNLPVYIIGGFGGASKLIADTLLSIRNELYTNDFNIIKQYSTSDLNNGLTNKENKILFNSRDSDVIISIILKGLKNIKDC